MSNFEIGQLQYHLRKAYADNNRMEIKAMMKQQIFSDYLCAGKDDVKRVYVVSRYDSVNVYMETIPDHEIPKHVTWMDAQRFLAKFIPLHDKWITDDVDETFSEFLQKVSETAN